MTRILLLSGAALTAGLLAATQPAAARTVPDTLTAAQAPAAAAGLILARHGGDDGAGHEHQGRGHEKGDDYRGRGHEKGDDNGGHHAASQTTPETVIARRGGDDGKGHDRGDDRGRGRGRDDGPNHG